MSNVKTGSFMQLAAATLRNVGRLGPKDRKTRKGRTRRKETVKLLIKQHENLQAKLMENEDVCLEYYRRPTIRCKIVRVLALLVALGVGRMLYPLMVPPMSESFLDWSFLVVMVLMIMIATWGICYIVFTPSANRGVDSCKPGYYWWLPMRDRAAIKTLTAQIDRLSKIDQEFQAKCQELSTLVDKFVDLSLVVTEELGWQYELIKRTKQFTAKISSDGETWESYPVSPGGHEKMAYRVAGLLAEKQKQQGIIISLNNKINELKKKGGH